MIFELARDQVANDSPPEPMVLMVSRLVPWASLFPALRARFAPLVAGPSARNDLWLSTRDGNVLKWWLPVGPVLDALAASDAAASAAATAASLSSSSPSSSPALPNMRSLDACDFATSSAVADTRAGRLPARVTVSFAAVPPKFSGLLTLPSDATTAAEAAKAQFLYSTKEASAILYVNSSKVSRIQACYVF